MPAALAEGRSCMTSCNPIIPLNKHVHACPHAWLSTCTVQAVQQLHQQAQHARTWPPARGIGNRGHNPFHRLCPAQGERKLAPEDSRLVGYWGGSRVMKASEARRLGGCTAGCRAPPTHLTASSFSGVCASQFSSWPASRPGSCFTAGCGAPSIVNGSAGAGYERTIAIHSAGARYER